MLSHIISRRRQSEQVKRVIKENWLEVTSLHQFSSLNQSSTKRQNRNHKIIQITKPYFLCCNSSQNHFAALICIVVIPMKFMNVMVLQSQSARLW